MHWHLRNLKTALNFRTKSIFKRTLSAGSSLKCIRCWIRLDLDAQVCMGSGRVLDYQWDLLFVSLLQPRDQLKSCRWWKSRIWNRAPPLEAWRCSWKDTTSNMTPKWCFWKRLKVKEETFVQLCVCLCCWRNPRTAHFPLQQSALPECRHMWHTLICCIFNPVDLHLKKFPFPVQQGDGRAYLLLCWAEVPEVFKNSAAVRPLGWMRSLAKFSRLWMLMDGIAQHAHATLHGCWREFLWTSR